MHAHAQTGFSLQLTGINAKNAIADIMKSDYAKMVLEKCTQSIN
jgi:S-ribosylhomocysteine lyase LuxS involved in autoinducer biosynthesis